MMNKMNREPPRFDTSGLFRERFDENLVGQKCMSAGQYCYHCDGKLLSIDEQWRRTNLPGEIVMTTCQRYAPEYGSHMWVMSLSQNGVIYEFKIQWQQRDENHTSMYETHYVISKNHTRVERLINGKRSLSKHSISSHQVIVSPLMRIYVGDTIDQLRRKGGSGSVMMPMIENPLDTQNVLTLRLSERSVEKINCAQLNDDAQHLQCYRYLGDQYDESALFCLNEHRILERYQWQQNDLFWEVCLQSLKST